MTSIKYTFPNKGILIPVLEIKLHFHFILNPMVMVTAVLVFKFLIQAQIH